MTTELVDAPAAFDWQNPDYSGIFQARIDRLTRLRKDPSLLPGVKAFYKDNPVAFVNDWGCTFDPRNIEIGRQALMPFHLFPRQEDFLRWLRERWLSRQNGLVEKSRDMGVSWLCVAFSVWMWLFYPGAVIGVGSRKEEYVDDLDNPDSLFWKARKFIETLPPEFRPLGWDTKKHAHYMKLINPENEAGILGEAGDNIGRGGRASIYFVDEAAFIEHQESVDAALSQTSNCKIDVSTPNGAGNAFYRKRHGGKLEVFVFDWHDDPRKNQAWYDKQVRDLDASIVAAEIDRNYESSISNAYIPGTMVDAAMKRGPMDVRPLGGLRVGVDVARFGDDKSAIVFRRGRVLLKVIRFGKSATTDTAARVHMEIQGFKEPPEQIAVDCDGLGAGVADMLRAWYPDRLIGGQIGGQLRKTVVDVHSGRRLKTGQHYDLRAFCWSELKAWIEGAALPNDQDLRVDLTALRYGFQGGELRIESKQDAKKRGVKSPDSGDALAYTFAEPTLPQETFAPMPAYQPFDSGIALG